jgi:hypothetical protein
MDAPQGGAGDAFERTTVLLGADTFNTCNPAVGDVDGDGLDELAVPLIEGDACRICLYAGDGAERWRNQDVRFFAFFYGDMDAYRRTHWHARSRHRHLFTRIFDLDGDGRPDVVCGDGPVWVLDAANGTLKRCIDLDAHVQTWTAARLHGPDAPPCFVGGIERRDGGGSAIVAIGPALEVEWSSPVEGRSFEDAIWAGDVDCDGRDEIVFATSSTNCMYLMDADGRLRWSQRVEGTIGDDSHVDDLVIDSVLGGAERQILMATGPALLDADGKILWTRGDRYAHAQRVLAVPAAEPAAPRRVYFCESYDRRAWLLDHAGEPLWSYDGFQRPRWQYEGRLTPRLTTAGGLADWSGDGRPVIIQAELITANRDAELDLEGPATFYATLLTADGRVLAHLPFEDRIDGVGGAMCALPGRFTAPDADAVAVITHSNSRLHFFSRR